MKKWSLIVAGLYGLTLLVLIGPLLWIAFGSKGVKLADLGRGLISWQVWAIFAVMATAQFALLRIPVHVTSRRPVTQRSLWTTIIAAAFMMGLLVFGAAAAIFEFISKAGLIEGNWLIPLGLANMAIWGGWAIYFHRSTRRASPDQKIARFRRYLWTGSILELLVAIPTHVIARHRDYCCAGLLTFFGLACGLSVMLFAFGPAVYFLFTERWKRLHPNHGAVERGISKSIG